MELPIKLPRKEPRETPRKTPRETPRKTPKETPRQTPQQTLQQVPMKCPNLISTQKRKNNKRWLGKSNRRGQVDNLVTCKRGIRHITSEPTSVQRAEKKVRCAFSFY